MDITSTRQTWEVRSMSGQALVYIVRLSRSGEYSCSCPHFTYQLAAIGGHCKHIAQLLPEGAVHGRGGVQGRQPGAWRSLPLALCPQA